MWNLEHGKPYLVDSRFCRSGCRDHTAVVVDTTVVVVDRVGVVSWLDVVLGFRAKLVSVGPQR